MVQKIGALVTAVVLYDRAEASTRRVVLTVPITQRQATSQECDY